MEGPHPGCPAGRRGSALGISSFVLVLALIKALLVLQKKIRFDYGSDEEIMERGIEMKGGTDSAIGEKSQGAVPPTVT